MSPVEIASNGDTVEVTATLDARFIELSIGGKPVVLDVEDVGPWHAAEQQLESGKYNLVLTWMSTDDEGRLHYAASLDSVKPTQLWRDESVARSLSIDELAAG